MWTSPSLFTGTTWSLLADAPVSRRPLRAAVLAGLAAVAVVAGGCAGWPFGTGAQEAYQAVRDDDVDALAAALEAGASIDQTDGAQRTLVHHAAVHGSESVAVHLLEEGAGPEASDRDGRRPLHEAAAGGYAAVVERLLAAGAEADVRDDRGRTPLMTAAANGHGAALEALLAAGADPDLRDEQGATALSLASAARYDSVSARLRQVSTRPAWPSALVGGVRAGDVETLAWMIDRGLPVNAAWQDGEEFVSLADIAAEASPRAASLLLGHGAELHRDGTDSLVAAALEGNRKHVERLLAEGADPDAEVVGGDADGRTLIMEVARLGHREVLDALLDAGADPAQQDQFGADALWHAARGYLSRADRAAGLERGGSRAPVLQALVAAGAEPGRGDDHGFTALHAAAAWGDEAAVDVLLDAGAPIEEADRNGRTPLVVAAQQGNEEAVFRLLRAGADPAAVDRIGATAVTYARLAESMADTDGLADRIREAGGGKATGPRQGTPPLTVGGAHDRIMRLDQPVAIYDRFGYHGEADTGILPYATTCRSHACLLPPVARLPAGTTVELVHRAVSGEGGVHGVYLVQEPGLRGLLFEDALYGGWPVTGAAESEIDLGRVAHIRSMEWVEAFEVDLPAATGGLFW